MAKNQSNYLNYSDLLDNFLNHEFYGTTGNSPRVNIREEADMFEIEMAVPGIRKKDINISIDKDVLQISHNSENENPADYRMREFNFSSFERTFNLPETVDTEKIEASMENGILKIRLFKKDDAVDRGPREIKIS